MVIEDCDAKQSVYVYGCKNSVLQIQGSDNYITCFFSEFAILSLGEKGLQVTKSFLTIFAGKVNNITIDNCKKMGVVFQVRKTL